MPAKVILEIESGLSDGAATRVFDERTTAIIGRSSECQVRLPDDSIHAAVSRHHCLLDVNPPDVRIRDLGSLNGTFINDRLIGWRNPDQSPTEVADMMFPQCDLHDGSLIRLDSAVIRVHIVIPKTCSFCDAEIPDDDAPNRICGPDQYQCPNCREVGGSAPTRPVPRPRICGCCGKDLSQEPTDGRRGEELCSKCHSGPADLALKLVQHAHETNEFGILKSCSIQGELGRGGFGAVYLVCDGAIDTKAALKLLLPEVTVDAKAKATFEREMGLASDLDHPHVVRLQSYGVWNAVCFSVWEYCDGGSVDQLMKPTHGPLGVREAVTIILDALDGLDYAHHARVKTRLQDGRVVESTGLVHRDIKPANIFLARAADRQIAKIGDYGLSKAFDIAGLSGLTRTEAMGSYQFVARQQVLDYRYAKPDVDVWAMAASLYYILTGFYARDFQQGKDIWQTILESAAVPIRKRRESIPKTLADVIDKALVERPEIGFKTAGEFKAALLRALEAP